MKIIFERQSTTFFLVLADLREIHGMAEKGMMDLTPTIRGIRKVSLMDHVDRAFSFTRIDSKGELMDAMFNHKWPLCCSFYHEKLLYLSDGEVRISPAPPRRSPPRGCGRR